VRRLFPAALLLLVLSPAAGFGVAAVPSGANQPWLRLGIAGVAAVVLARWALWPFLRWWNTVYAITDRRLVTRSGVLARIGHDMPLTRLNDVYFTQSLVERLLGCGDLVVQSAGERGQLVLDDVPRVERVQRVLYELADEAGQRESDDDRDDDDRDDDDRDDDR
jgi:uncharacterized membrane protein YdbT with pleckstrin-like domain